MKHWGTYIEAIHPITGELVLWCGPTIAAPSKRLAQQYCEDNGLGYCKVDGELIMDVPCKAGTDNDPDWSKKVDYTLPDMN
jgi:hypothetical protein